MHQIWDDDLSLEHHVKAWNICRQDGMEIIRMRIMLLLNIIYASQTWFLFLSLLIWVSGRMFSG
jgi:hypothetical protein